MDEKKFLEWSGIQNYERIDITNVYGNKYRVNVWVRKQVPEKVIDTFSIYKSYFLEDNETIKDLTI